MCSPKPRGLAAFLVVVTLSVSSCQQRKADVGYSDSPADLGKWVSVTPPGSSREAWIAANHSQYHWTVYGSGGRVRARLSKPWNKGNDIHGPIPPFKIPVNPDIQLPPEMATVITCRVPDGWLIAHYAGEWGGSIWWYSASGKESYRVSEDMVKSFVSTPGSLHVAEGLAHLHSSTGAIKKVLKDAKTGKWTTELLVELPKAPDCAISDGRGGLLVAADDLLQVSMNGQIKTLVKGAEWGCLYPASMVLSPDNTLYVGMRQGVARVEAVFENPRYSWLVPSKELLRETK